MNLSIQILSIIFSTIYGFFIGAIYNLSYDFLYNNFSKYKILTNFLFMTDVTLIYFVIIQKINNGNIRLTFLIILFLFFLIAVKTTRKLRKIVKCLQRNH